MVTSNLRRVDIWVDGSTQEGNPGKRGGWGAVLVYEGAVRSVSGIIPGPRVTNNQAETDAVTNAISLLTKPCYVNLHTDSNYFILCANKVLAGRLPNKNKDNFLRFKDALDKGQHTLRLIKVEGHSGNEYNDAAHKLAHTAAKEGELTDERSET